MPTRGKVWAITLSKDGAAVSQVDVQRVREGAIRIGLLPVAAEHGDKRVDPAGASLQQRRVHEREHCSVGGDRQCENQHGDGCESWCSSQQTKAVTEV